MRSSPVISAASAAPLRRTILSYTSRASSRSGKPIMPERCASMRSIAKCVLPVLVGPRTAVTLPRSRGGTVLSKVCRERGSPIDSTHFVEPSGFCPGRASASAALEGHRKPPGKSFQGLLGTKKGGKHRPRTKRARITNRANHHYSFTYNISSSWTENKPILAFHRRMTTTQRVTHRIINFTGFLPPRVPMGG